LARNMRNIVNERAVMSPAPVTRATVVRVQNVIRTVLTDHLSSLGRAYPSMADFAVELGPTFCLQPDGEKLRQVCHRISSELFCKTPPRAVREKWTSLLDLYVYYLGCGQMHPDNVVSMRTSGDAEK
jgi:hypothetical protein